MLVFVKMGNVHHPLFHLRRLIIPLKKISKNIRHVGGGTVAQLNIFSPAQTALNLPLFIKKNNNTFDIS